MTSKVLKILGISCSPRPEGNTDILVRHVLESAKEEGAATEFLRIADLNVTPCDACWTCAQSGQCHIKDGMTQVYPSLLAAHAIVIGSPVHMGYGVSGQAQVFFDRTFSFWHRKDLRNKVGGSVAVSSRRGGISVIKVINNFFFNHRMIVAGYANGYGREKGEILKDKRAFDEARELGKRIIELARILYAS